jgi:PucR family transcriptional regulator, purine catabolism regulatory protein
MVDNNSATLQALLRFALPLGTSLITGEPNTTVDWSVTVRAQPPDVPTIYGGELALVSMSILGSYDNRITAAGVIANLADAGVRAVAIEGEITPTAITVANEREVSLLGLPDNISLSGVERAVNKFLVNQTSQLTERAIEIQRQLTALAAENRDLNSLLQVMARATAKPIVIHDDAGVLMGQVFPAINRRGNAGRTMLQNLPYGNFQKWLNSEAASSNGDGKPLKSPIGHTAVLKGEKRVAGYLSLVDKDAELDDFDRLVLLYGADVCAIELAKNRAIASAVEQARGDWVQMWLSGTPADDDLLATRAQQAGFDPDALYVVAVFRPSADSGQALPLESLISLVRDDMARRQLGGAVGQYVDVIVALYPLDSTSQLERSRSHITELRAQLALRTPSGIVASGVSRPCQGLTNLREAYREAKDAVSIAHELGEHEDTTYYGDLKLYQLLLALKERNLEHMRSFYEETLGPLVEHDKRKQSDLVRTLNGFFTANGNLAKAAQDLDVHRNTLVYRLERISELTDLDLNDADNRLILHLALKTQRVLATLPHSNTTGRERDNAAYRVTR